MNHIVAVDYDDAARIEAILTEQQEAAQRILERLHGCVEKLEAGAWIGANADRFYGEMHDDVLPACGRLAQAYERAAATLAQAMVSYQEAEEDAAALFAGDKVGVAKALAAGAGTAAAKQAAQGRQKRLFSGEDGGLIGAPPQDAAIFYINGIQTNPDQVVDAVGRIESITGRPVMGIYNATAGKLDLKQMGQEALDIGRTLASPHKLLFNPLGSIKEIAGSAVNIGKGVGGISADLLQAGNDLGDASYDLRLDSGNPAVRQLVNQIRDHEGPLVLIGHSQGAAIVAAALNDLHREGYALDHITVTTLGGAGVDFPPGPQYNHRVNHGDFVPFVAQKFNNLLGGDTAGREMSASRELSARGTGHGMEAYYDDIESLHGAL